MKQILVKAKNLMMPNSDLYGHIDLVSNVPSEVAEDIISNYNFIYRCKIDDTYYFRIASVQATDTNVSIITDTDMNFTVNLETGEVKYTYIHVR